MCHAMSFSAHEKSIFFNVDIVAKKKIKMWFSIVCTLIVNDEHYHSGQHLLWLRSLQHFDHCDDTYCCR